MVSEKIFKNRPIVRVEGTTNLLFPHTQSISIYPGTISYVLKIYSTELVLFNILSLLYTRIFLSRTTYLYYPNGYILVSTNISLLSTRIYFCLDQHIFTIQTDIFLSRPTYLYYPHRYIFCLNQHIFTIQTDICIFVWILKIHWSWQVPVYIINALLYSYDYIFSSPCQRQGELLPSLGVRRPLTFHILISSSETPQPNELTLGRKHLWKVHYKDLEYKPISSCQIAAHLSILSTT